MTGTEHIFQYRYVKVHAISRYIRRPGDGTLEIHSNINYIYRHPLIFMMGISPTTKNGGLLAQFLLYDFVFYNTNL